MRIRDVLSPTIGVRYEEPSGLTLDRMRAFGCHHLIVTKENAIRGVVSESELARACSMNPDTPVGELATDVPVVESDAPIEDAANLMRDRKVGCLPVVDQAALAGIVTIERLLELIGQGVVQTVRRRK